MVKPLLCWNTHGFAKTHALHYEAVLFKMFRAEHMQSLTMDHPNYCDNASQLVPTLHVMLRLEEIHVGYNLPR